MDNYNILNKKHYQRIIKIAANYLDSIAYFLSDNCTLLDKISPALSFSNSIAFLYIVGLALLFSHCRANLDKPVKNIKFSKTLNQSIAVIK